MIWVSPDGKIKNVDADFSDFFGLPAAEWEGRDVTSMAVDGAAMQK